MQAHYIVYDLTTGEAKRHGTCPEEHVQTQARAHKNEGVMLDTKRTKVEARDLLIERRVVIPASAEPYLRRRSVAEVTARRARLSRRPPS